MNAQPFKAGDHVSSGATIAEIPDLSTIAMESKVDETDRGHIAEGDPVQVHVDASPEKVFNGKLTAISLLTEQSFEEWPPVATFRAFALIDPPDQRLRPGMNATADIVQTKLPNVISVPAKALFTYQGKPVVYVKTGDFDQRTSVTVRARNIDEVAVDGLRAGSMVTLVDPELAEEMKRYTQAIVAIASIAILGGLGAWGVRAFTVSKEIPVPTVKVRRGD